MSLFYYTTIYNIHGKQSNAFVAVAIFFKFFIYVYLFYILLLFYFLSKQGNQLLQPDGCRVSVLLTYS